MAYSLGLLPNTRIMSDLRAVAAFMGLTGLQLARITDVDCLGGWVVEKGNEPSLGHEHGTIAVAV